MTENVRRWGKLDKKLEIIAIYFALPPAPAASRVHIPVGGLLQSYYYT